MFFLCTRQTKLAFCSLSRTIMASEEVAVFAETNLGTRIVMTVPLDITAAHFKRKLEKTHASCLSSLGEIRVHGLMVKRKSRFYYLAESLPLKYLFRYNQKPWFINAEARVVNGSQKPSVSNSIDTVQVRQCSTSDNSIKEVIGLIRGENKKVKKSRAKPDSRNLASGQRCIEKREFIGPSTPEPETIRSSLSIARAAEMKNCEMISKKLIVAANNIRMEGKTHVSSSLSSSIFRRNTRRKRSLDGKTVASLAKFMAFEVPETED